MKTRPLYSLLLLTILISACGGGSESEPDPCSIPINLTVSNQQNAAAGQSTGSFVVVATGGNGGFQYQLNNGSFQSSGTFNGLAAGSYNITARDNQQCTQTIQVTVDEDAPASVPSFANVVLPIMQSFCATSGCHVTGGSAPFVITGHEDVAPRAASIKSRVAAQTMPPSGSASLSSNQIASIVAWVDGGAPNN
uniref:hypothetical protein n=1 Tax=Roseivirga sp. TaxID=1964215 RepID=UPI0040482B42